MISGETSIINLFLIFALILFIAKIFGELAEKINLPSIIGEILTGIILGPYLLQPFLLDFNLIGSPILELEGIQFLANLGILLLFFSIGYEEVDIEELKQVSKEAFTIVGIGLPLAYTLGFIVGQIFGKTILASLFIGLALSITSVAVGARILIDLGKLNTDYGLTILNIGVLEAVLALLGLSILTGLVKTGKLSLVKILLLLIKISIFFIGSYIIGKYLLEPITKHIEKFNVEEAIFGLLIALFFAWSYFASIAGVDAVIGAFLIGIILSEFEVFNTRNIKEKIDGLAYGIFIPIFFAVIGVQVDLKVLITSSTLTFTIIFVAIVGKILSGFIGGKLAGYSIDKSLVIGAGLTPRTGVELAVISVALSEGVIGKDIFTSIVAMVAVAIFLAPVLLKITISNLEKETT